MQVVLDDMVSEILGYVRQNNSGNTYQDTLEIWGKINMGEKNIGGYDENYKYDSLAVNYLEGRILKSKYLIPHISSGDKVPNLDGAIELCEDAVNKINPIAKFEVQIKSLNHDYNNSNIRDNTQYPYKYSCETKCVNVVLQGITLNPVLLILVDSKNEHIYWKYMNERYCLKLDVGCQKEKTIYFSNEDEVTDIDEWGENLRSIYKSYKYNLKSSDCFLLPEEERTVPEEIQKMSDYINGLLDNELWFIKKSLFPQMWKLGIAYFDGKNTDFSCLGFYIIKKGKNDVFIKQFKNEWDYFVSIKYGGSYSLEDIVKETLKNWIDLFFENEHYPLEIMPDEVLIEILFEKIDNAVAEARMGDKDKVHVKLALEEDKITISEAREIINKYNCSPMLCNCIISILEERGYSEIKRPWRTLVDYHISKCTDNCISYEPDDNRDSNDIYNMTTFIKRYMNFFNKCKKYMGRLSAPLFDIRHGRHVIILDDDMEGYLGIAEGSDDYCVEVYTRKEKCELYNSIQESWRTCDSQFGKICRGTACKNDYSWYKLWRVMNRRLCYDYIGVDTDKDMTDDYNRC